MISKIEAQCKIPAVRKVGNQHTIEASVPLKMSTDIVCVYFFVSQLVGYTYLYVIILLCVGLYLEACVCEDIKGNDAMKASNPKYLVWVCYLELSNSNFETIRKYKMGS